METYHKPKRSKSSPAQIEIPQNVTRILAFDLSLTATGFCAYPDCQTLRIDPSRGDDVDRIIRMSHAVVSRSALATLKDYILVVLEGFAFGRIHRSHELGGLGYMVRAQLRERNIPFIVVPPTKLKKFVCGSGTAKKEAMVKEVYKRFGIDTDDHNIADAVGLAHVGAALCGLWQPTTEFQRAVLREMGWREVAR